jgi:membrane-associated protein
VIDEILAQVATGPWALPLLGLLVLGDAFLVVVPGEAAVTAAGALAVATGSPPLAAVVAVAAVAAFTGDACCYLIGRRVGLERWRWMRHPRVHGVFAWAADRLEHRSATIMFTARFIPFARIAVTLTAGASRIAAPRFLAVCAAAALAWAAYQALIGAIVAALVPGGPVVAVLISIAAAIALGVGLDALLARRTARRIAPRPPLGDGRPHRGHRIPPA